MFNAINPFVWLILEALRIYTYLVIAAVVMSWLINFNILNYHNNFVRSAIRVLDALTEPVFRQVRRILPALGGLDLSPLVVLLGIYFLQNLVVWLYVKFPF